MVVEWEQHGRKRKVKEALHIHRMTRKDGSKNSVVELYMERFHGNGLKNLNSAVILKITPPKKKFGARGWHKESFLKIWAQSDQKSIFLNQTKFGKKFLNALYHPPHSRHLVCNHEGVTFPQAGKVEQKFTIYIWTFHAWPRKHRGRDTRTDIYGYRHGSYLEAKELCMAPAGEEHTLGPRRGVRSLLHWKRETDLKWQFDLNK